MSQIFHYKLIAQKAENHSDGFTLIELLVVILIITILSAIALPSYLNQTSKVRASEAKSVLGSINRAQQAYRVENQTMANSLNVLNSTISGKFYSYQVVALNENVAVSNTLSLKPDLRIYSARIQQVNDAFIQIICESSETKVQGSLSESPINNTNCETGYKAIK
jgi:type IV pilus assembly protein PilA